MVVSVVNRIDAKFAELKDARRAGLVVYITAGDPNLERTADLAPAVERAGADVLELGVPFSDPLADGPVNQMAAQRALEAGTTVKGILRTVREIRRRGCAIPIVLFSYLNPLMRYGLERLFPDSAEAGVDGFLLLDLPPEEGSEARRLARRAGLHLIYLLAPTSPEERIRKVARDAGGFVYYVSREGVTGMQDRVQSDLGRQVARVRRLCPVPVAVGFGIATPEQAATVAGHADAVVVGSAIVDRIARTGDSEKLTPTISRFVGRLARAVREVPK